MKADHFAFPVSDMDRAIRFYTEILGLKLISRTYDEKHDEEFAFIELEGGNLELLRKPGGSPEIIEEMGKTAVDKLGFCPHLALETDDIKKAEKMLKEAGVRILGGPYSIENKVEWMYFADPDGNILEFVSWIGK